MIREAEGKDFEQIYNLGEQLHENYQQKYNLKELIKEKYFHILVYQQNEQILGFLIYTTVEDSTDIVDIFVDKKYRNQKIASNLIDRMISNSSPKMIFLLEVAVDNDVAINLYEKFGFKIIHTRKKYYGKKDAYVMERVIENE